MLLDKRQENAAQLVPVRHRFAAACCLSLCHAVALWYACVLVSQDEHHLAMGWLWGAVVGVFDGVSQRELWVLIHPVVKLCV